MHQNNEILIRKASGEREPFSEKKLRRSLERINAPNDLIEKIINHIHRELKPDMSTSEIYQHAFSLLSQHPDALANRYSLKNAILELGPEGYFFEKFIGKLLISKGFQIELDKTLKGACVNHEIDIIAQKDKRYFMIECKFHNQSGIKSDVKTSLYIQARFQDIENEWKKNPFHSTKFEEAWLVTNTKLSTDAIRYAECVGMKAIGWNYPENESLEILIEKASLHPITCLRLLSKKQKQQLLEKNIILCQELINERSLLEFIHLQKSKMNALINELNILCNIKTK